MCDLVHSTNFQLGHENELRYFLEHEDLLKHVLPTNHHDAHFVQPFDERDEPDFQFDEPNVLHENHHPMLHPRYHLQKAVLPLG